jgi:hypothetical protein
VSGGDARDPLRGAALSLGLFVSGRRLAAAGAGAARGRAGPAPSSRRPSCGRSEPAPHSPARPRACAGARAFRRR